MEKVGRNDLCPCGSGKKFKKCHMGREDELVLYGIDEITEEISVGITSLPEVDYGRSREIVDAIDIKELTGNEIGIKFIDLKQYSDLNLPGTSPMAAKGKGGGVFINIIKTIKTDPNNIYFAISPDIDDSTLIHELAHALDYLGGSKIMPGISGALSYELDVPVEHLEHVEEFGYWLNYLKNRFDVQLDADDTIISFLYENGMLLKGKDVDDKDSMILKTKSNQMLKFLNENAGHINTLICNLSGYIGEIKP